MDESVVRELSELARRLQLVSAGIEEAEQSVELAVVQLCFICEQDEKRGRHPSVSQAEYEKVKEAIERELDWLRTLLHNREEDLIRAVARLFNDGVA